MASGVVVRTNEYYDSVFLMRASKRLSEVHGVQQTAVLMGTEKNKKLLEEIGIGGPQVEAAQPNDLIVAVIAESPEVVQSVLGRLDEWLQASPATAGEVPLRTLDEGLARAPGANLAVISVPGAYAAREARKALEAGLHVFLFSDNVSVEDELALKQLARERGRLVMGPGCGTSLIAGKGLGFANAVRRGAIGAVGAAGTGLQEFTSLVHNLGGGISHAIGTGGRDLSDAIGGLTAFAALDALQADPLTHVVCVLSKPPGVEVRSRLLKRLAEFPKPVVACLLGADLGPQAARGNLHIAQTLDDAAEQVCRLAEITARIEAAEMDAQAAADRERAAWAPEQKYLRGLFAGGSLCYQTQHILRAAGLKVHSNTPLHGEPALENPDRSREHTMVDMGDDYFTVGRPHPMIDGTQRAQRIRAEARDPQVRLLLLDIVLGYNAARDPVGDLLDAIGEARQAAAQRGGALTVVASICGTALDPQDMALQARLLREAGAIVFPSNARAAQFCVQLLA